MITPYYTLCYFFMYCNKSKCYKTSAEKQYLGIWYYLFDQKSCLVHPMFSHKIIDKHDIFFIFRRAVGTGGKRRQSSQKCFMNMYIQGFHQVWYQGGVKSTVSGVVEDLMFKRAIFQTFWRVHCCPDSLFFEIETSNFGSSYVFLSLLKWQGWI